MNNCGFCLAIFLTFFTFTRQYKTGTEYSFAYETSTLLNEPQVLPISSPKDVGFKVDLAVSLIPIWQSPSDSNEQIFELKVSSPKLAVKARRDPAPDGFVTRPSKADSLQQLPFYLHRVGGTVKNVYYANEEPLSWLNVKKGIASLFQYQTKDGTGEETDASGTCEVTYTLQGNARLLKSKTNCRPLPDKAHFFNHTDKVLSADLRSTSETTYELDLEDSTLKACSSVESHVLRPEARRSSGVEVIGKQALKLEKKKPASLKTFTGSSAGQVLNELSRHIGQSLTAEGLSTTPDPKECIACKSLKDLVNSFRKSLLPASLGKQSSAIAFLRLLGKFRESNEKTIKAVIKDKKNAHIIPQLLDIAAATQTIPAHNAAKSILDFNGKTNDLSERYFLSLSLATHPLEFVIEDLLKVYKKGLNNDHLSETLILSIATMTKTFASQTKNSKQMIISNVRREIVNSLEGCREEPCVLKYVRALKNLQSKDTLSTLLSYARGRARKPAIYAMRAIQTMPTDYIDAKVLKELEPILLELDSEHDSSVRAMTAEVLLRWRPESSLLKDIFVLLKRPTSRDREVNTLILGHVLDLCEKNPDMEELVNEVIHDNGLANYDILSQGGLSSAFSRPLAEGAAVNASFVNMLEISDGIMKRSNVDVFVDAGDARLKLLSFGMFAGGLSMFGSSSGDASAEVEDEEAHAGIEISLLGSQLRPFVFFRGQGELMGHVWSGTASERTTALQGSLLLQDHNEVVALQNGLNIEFSLTGAVSYDFAGQVQVSLWNRNAHSLVEVGAAVVVRGQARVDNSFVQTMVEFNVGSQTQLDFISDLEFSGDIMMCLRMVQPDFEIIDNLRKLERIPGSNYVLRKYKRKSSYMPGKTYVMNRKNTEICNKMFGNAL